MLSDEIEIEYRPIKRVVILDVTQLSKKELFTRVSGLRQAGEPAFLSWAGGFVFFATPLPFDIKEVGREIIQGVLYLQSVEYSSMPVYKSFVEAGTDRIPVIDQSKDRISIAIAKWISARGINKT
jgi:hypothetical protein